MNSIDVAYYIIENESTIAEAANHFGVCPSTIQNKLKKLECSSNKDEQNLILMVRNVQKSIQSKKVSLGGILGKRDYSHNQGVLDVIYDTIVNEGLTLRQCQEKLGIPKSTIYENLKRLPKEKQEEIKKAFRRNKGINDHQNDVDNNYAFHNIGSDISSNKTIKRGK